ncbi:MAG: hypothetical protein M1398_00860 [Deltaproteobacteria bacterium]|jgi:hypothetical protein|nr:hypothetical protein [Deltaproteobacteria bacterium]MDA8308367.1 hypothetical protein [Deltaproteobacteria bacterium]
MDTSDQLWTRCPRLGGEAPLTYCLREAGTLPCHRIIACWQACFPIETFLKERLSPQQWQEFEGRRPKDKLASLLELIDEAKRATETKQ